MGCYRLVLMCVGLQALKTLALAGPRPVSAASHQEILGIVESVKMNAKGAAMADADVLAILAWVLEVLGRGMWSICGL